MKKTVVSMLSTAVLCFGSVACGLLQIRAADHSFAVEAEVVETSTIVSVMGSLSRRSASAADIVLNGSIREPLISGVNVPVVPFRNQDGAHSLFIRPGYSSQRMFWNGAITIQGVTRTAEIEFVKWTTRDGHDEQFIMNQAVLGQVRLNLPDPLDIEQQSGGSFPYLIGDVQTASSRYRIYAGRDNARPSNTAGTITVFFNMEQKFQFLDAQNRVVAELERGTLTLYNTLAESERTAIREASALFVAFRHAAIYTARNRQGWGNFTTNWSMYP